MHTIEICLKMCVIKLSDIYKTKISCYTTNYMQKTLSKKLIIIVSIVIFVTLGLYVTYQNRAEYFSKIKWQDTVQNAPKTVFKFTEYAPRYDDGSKTDVADAEISLEGTEQISYPFHNSTEKFDNTAKLIEQFYKKYEKQIQVDTSWNQVLSLAADGPGSSQTGYRKLNSKGQMGYVIFSYHTELEREVPDGPSECPCTTVFKIFKGVDVNSEITPAMVSNGKSENSDIKYKMVRGEFGTYTYPQVVSFGNVDKKIVDGVNKNLGSYFGELGCEDDFQAHIQVQYARNGIFSVLGQSMEEACSENTTNASGYYYTSITFDLRTGEEISFTDLFINYTAQEDKILSLIYKQQIADSVDHPSACNSLEMLRETSHDYEFSTTTRTLLVTPQYPFLSRACVDSARVSIDSLLPFLKKDSFLKNL